MYFCIYFLQNTVPDGEWGGGGNRATLMLGFDDIGLPLPCSRTTDSISLERERERERGMVEVRYDTNGK